MNKFIKRYWLLIISLLYVIWPLDLISEVFGPIGLIDDGLILTTTLVHEAYRYYKSTKSKTDSNEEDATTN